MGGAGLIEYAYVVGPFSRGVVATKGIRCAVGEVMDVVEQDELDDGGVVLTCFDIRGLGGTVAIREAAVRNNLLHIRVDLRRCAVLKWHKDQCMKKIEELRSELRGSRISNTKIVLVLAVILRKLAERLWTDCLAAVEREDSGSFREVYLPDTLSDDVADSPINMSLDDSSDMRNPYSAINALHNDMLRCIDVKGRKPGGRAGVLIHLDNSEAVFFSDCMPQDELRSPYNARFSTERMGAFMFRALIHSMRGCIGCSPKIIWAFTGVRKSIGYSFQSDWPFLAVDLSEHLEYFDAGDVVKALSEQVQIQDLGHAQTMYLKHLEGPPIVVGLFRDYVSENQTSDIAAEWASIENFIIAGLYDKYKSATCDAEVAKFCCIASLFSYTGQLDVAMDTMHSSVWAIADSSLLRVRKSPTHEWGGCKLHFDRPYPMLLTLFAAKYGLPNYVVGPLMRAIGSLSRNSSLHWRTVAEIAFAFDLHRIFEGSVGDVFRTVLGVVPQSFANQSPRTTRASEDVVTLSVVQSLAGIQFGANRIFVEANPSVDAESNHVFRLALETATSSGEHVKILLSISLRDHEDTVVRRELCNMAATAASYWSTEKKVRTLCVFTGPYFKPGLNVEPRAWFDEVASALRTCAKCRMMQGTVDGCSGCSQACAENSELLKCLVFNEPKIYSCSAKDCVTPQIGRPFSFYYFGGNHDFWGSCPLHQAIRLSERTALTSYLLSRVNLKHVSDLFREPGDTRVLVWDMQRLDMNIIRLCALEPHQDPMFSRFPAGMTHFVSCMAAYFHGLSILDASDLNRDLQLALEGDEEREVNEFALLYRQHMQQNGLPDPGESSCDVQSITDCLRRWGTCDHDVAEIEKWFGKSGSLKDLSYTDLSRLEVLMGTKLALKNIDRCVKRRPHAMSSSPKALKRART